ncbi:hypothetical protein F511_27523 [Dorcoceras hygrometricum]|uniref:S-protein homolog n=1 Tax=Dorcoceras hygrometricum TaxID=472368 RepID=A0A2Z7AW16_9LAMI|nr:hypothetical protein F511_27523 [Dorcoceras hygrometricum]
MGAAVFLRLATTFLLLSGMTTAKSSDKKIVITNSHTNYLSLRCFSFEDSFSVVHLKPWQTYVINITIRTVYPSATMFNCSTNMGNFVAYRYDYECSDDKYEACHWRFNENNAYRYEPKSGNWFTYDYDPNYESLTRGGVIKGYYAN